LQSEVILLTQQAKKLDEDLLDGSISEKMARAGSSNILPPGGGYFLHGESS
jgi:hypothetical protein